MLNRIQALGACLAVAAFIGTAVAADKPADKAADNTHTGLVVMAADGKLTMTGKDGKEHTHAVAKDAKISCDGKDCKLEDLKKGQTATVTVEKQGDDTVITKIEAKNADVAAAGGLYFNAKADPNDDSLLWTMQKEGAYVLLISKSAKAALDVNNEKGNLYVNGTIDPKNNNQLWTVKAQGDHSMLIPKVRASILDNGALDADNGKDKPYINPKTDAANNNELWTLDKHGDFYMLLPKGLNVALGVKAATTVASPDKSNSSVTGVVASVGDDRITVSVDGKDHALTVAKDAKISCDGKECKLEDLKKGTAVTVRLNPDHKDVAASIEAKTAAKDK